MARRTDPGENDPMQQSPFHPRSPVGKPLRLVSWVLGPLLLLSTLSPGCARAETNPLLVLLKNAVYGGASGLLLGGVLTLVVEEENRDDVVRWGVVIGTFSGFAYGLYDLRSGGDSFDEFSRLVMHRRRAPIDTEGTGSEARRSAPEIDRLPLPLSPALALGRTLTHPGISGVGGSLSAL